MKNLMTANMLLAGALPLFNEINIVIVLVNGGFILSQYGH